MSTQTQIRTLALDALVLSQSPIQVERRAQFDREALREMSVTIKGNGRVEQAITVRLLPVEPKNEHLGLRFEVADGERRVLATEMAGLEEILAEVRELTDEQVEEIQIVTGLQKEKLHELVEAEGYETLHRRGLTVEEIAHKCARSPATVYARMKLLALCKEGREAVRSGKLSASVGLLVARIPIEKLQKDALTEIAERERHMGEPTTYREASQLIQRRFMLRLEQAPFDVTDETLVKPAGACGACPKNTSCQPELFADVSSGAMCTDQACFASKKSAHVNRQVTELKAAGTRVFRGAEAKKISPHGGDFSLKDGWVSLHSVGASSLAKDAEVAVLQMPNNPDRLVKIVKQTDVRKPPRQVTKSSGSVTPKARTQEEALNDEYEDRLFLALHVKAPKQLPLPTLVAVADKLLEDVGVDDRCAILFKAWGWHQDHGPATKDLQKLKDWQLNQLIFELLLFNMNAAPDLVESTAKRMGIDAKKIRAEVKAALVPPAPAKASKKKAGKR